MLAARQVMTHYITHMTQEHTHRAGHDGCAEIHCPLQALYPSPNHVLCINAHVINTSRTPAHLPQAPVDVLGMVLSVGPLGTIKRRADNSELQRRDVTIGDARFVVQPVMCCMILEGDLKRVVICIKQMRCFEIRGGSCLQCILKSACMLGS